MCLVMDAVEGKNKASHSDIFLQIQIFGQNHSLESGRSEVYNRCIFAKQNQWERTHSFSTLVSCRYIFSYDELVKDPFVCMYEKGGGGGKDKSVAFVEKSSEYCLNYKELSFINYEMLHSNSI